MYAALETTRPEIPSNASIAGHPIHPILVPIPIVALLGALACDVLYTRTQDRFFGRSASLFLGTGIAGGLLAGAVGAIDYTTIRPVRDNPLAQAHMLGNLTALALAGLNLLSRRGSRNRVTTPHLTLSALTVGLLSVTAALGGELTFRYKIGVDSRPPAEANGYAGSKAHQAELADMAAGGPSA